MAKKEEQKKNYRLLGRHDDLQRGEVISLTKEEASQSCFTNKLKLILDESAKDEILVSTEKQAAKVISEAEKKAQKIILAASEKASEMLGKAKEVVTKIKTVQDEIGDTASKED